MLGLALFIGQAFLYNGITFNLGTLFSRFYGVSSSYVPVFVIVFAASSFLGPLLLGRFFDTIGRKPMIAGSYLGSAAVATVMAILFANDRLGSAWGLELFIVLTFFLASAGASAAYLTVSEVFPMETRALAIAFFYAVGTAIGGITGPLLFGHLVDSGSRGQVAVGFLVAAAVMALGGLAEVFLGVPAEQAALEDIAPPLTAEAADDEQAAPDADERRTAPDAGGAASARRVALEAQRRAIERDRRVREGLARRRARERAGLRRYRPGPRVALFAPRMAGLADPADADAALLDREIAALGGVLEERGPLGREALRSAVGARYWGPGRFSRALREACSTVARCASHAPRSGRPARSRPAAASGPTTRAGSPPPAATGRERRRVCRGTWRSQPGVSATRYVGCLIGMSRRSAGPGRPSLRRDTSDGSPPHAVRVAAAARWSPTAAASRRR